KPSNPIAVRLIAALCAFPAGMLAAPCAFADSVGQVQTTKFLTQETIDMLIARAGSGMPGLQVGDTISYIIQFTPINNGSDTGVAGYITDYIPTGVDVIGASFVAKSGSSFYDISPALPNGAYSGWGTRTPTYLAPFNVAGYDPTGRCAAGGYTNNCRSRMSELYADTGIFFSTDSRTAQCPLLPTRIAQGTNGYKINPNGADGLNTLLDQTSATTHNQWDAANTNAFGTSSLAGQSGACQQTQAILSYSGGAPYGQGATPYYVGSAVAGPQTGYQLDYTKQIGPWQRIYYPNSRIGNSALGPATAAGVLGTVGGSYTSVGWNLSSGNPLPAGTNAVRWAVGGLTVGTLNYVKISMRITAAPPASGIVNSSEVFGGDASSSGGRDSVWKYHVPSVADNNSNLYVLKTVLGYYSGAVLIPTDGSYIPANAKIRYRISYLNSGNADQNGVILSDTLPCQTPIGSITNIAVNSGPISATITPAAPANGICGLPDTRRTVSFNNGVGVVLTPAAGGSIDFDVQTNAGTGSIVSNTATLTSAAINPGVNSVAHSYVPASPSPNLSISLTTSTPTVAGGGTATYTITVINNGTAAAGGINVYALPPTTGGAANAATRFTYSSTTSIVGMTSVAPTSAVPPTLTPYSADPSAANWQETRWNFGAQTLAAGASFTITFNAAVGTSVPASTTPYYSTAVVTYTGGTVTRTDAVNVAPVTVTSTLSITMSITDFSSDGGVTWTAYGNYIPPNARVRYRIDYANTGAGTVTNANISDLLPCQTAAGSVSNIVIVSGPIGLPATIPGAGNCSTGTRPSFTFTSANLAAGQVGQITFDVQTNAANGNIVVNTATLSAIGASPTISEVQTTVQSTLVPTVAKTNGTNTLTPGATTNYTVVITNATGAAQSGVTFRDPAVTNLTVNTVTCTAATGGAVCPAGATVTVSAMQGSGIPITSSMPNGSSVTFTLNATLNVGASGTLTNTARVNVSSQTNQVSDTDTIKQTVKLKIFGWRENY
ncbi:MAG: DUF11 domain-containing protein, partial [Nitrospirae bacterium]|nr:DUF11 domain-containing protein [Nitrospirota bacterium]